MGYRVLHNYASWLTWTDSSPDYVILHAVTGLDIKFTYSSNSGGYDYYTPQKGYFFDYLRQNTSTGQWQLRSLTGTVHVYNWSSPVGKLIAIQDGSGNSVDITYNGDGQIDKVYDATDRKFLKFEYFSSGTKLLQYVKYYTTNGSTDTLRVTVTFAYTSDKLDTTTIASTLIEDLSYSAAGHMTKIEDGESTKKTIASFVYAVSGGSTTGEVVQMETPNGDIGFDHDVTCGSTAGSHYIFSHHDATTACDADADCGNEAFCGGQTGGSGETGTCYQVRQCVKVNSSNPDLIEAVSAETRDSGTATACASCVTTADRDWEVGGGSNNDIKLLGEKLPDNVWTSYERNADGLVIKMVEADTDGDATTVPGGSRVTFYYYDTNYPSLVAEVRRRSELAPLQGGECDVDTATDCKQTIYTYTSAGLVASIQEKGKTYEVDVEDEPPVAIVGYDFTTTNSYDSQGRLTSVTGPRPSTEDDVEYTYHTTGGELKQDYLKEVKRQIGTSTFLTTTLDDYNYWGEAESEKDPNANFTCSDFDDNRGFLKERRVAMNNQTSCASSHSSDMVTKYTRDTALRLTKIEKPMGDCVFQEYDGEGRLLKTKPRDDCVSGNAGDTMEYTYSLDGLQTKVEYKDTSSTVTYRQELEYYKDRRLRKQKNPVQTSYSREWTYEDDGQPASLTFENGLGGTEWDYDLLNREVERRRYTSLSTPAYDTWSIQNCLQIDARLNVVDDDNKDLFTRWDDLHRKVEQVTPDSGSTFYAYDEAGNMIGMVEAYNDADQVASTLVYDLQNRLTSIDYDMIDCGTGQGPEIQYAYDNLPSGLSCPSGSTCANNDAKLAYAKVKMFCDSGETDKTFDQETFYTYDDAGRVHGTAVKDDGGRAAKTTFAINKNGVLFQVYYPSGVISLLTPDHPTENSDMDKMRQVNRLIVAPSTTLVEAGKYRPFGPVREYRQLNSRNSNLVYVRSAHNLAYRPTEIVFEEGTSGSDLFKIAYAEDEMGRITERNFSSGATGLQDAYYSYDEQSRVTCDSAVPIDPDCPDSGSDLKSNLTAGYTASGERIELIHRHSTFGNNTLTPDYIEGTDQLFCEDQEDEELEICPSSSTAYSWDSRGNRESDDMANSNNDTREYTYDERNNVLTVSGKFPSGGSMHDYVLTNAYDEKNRRIFKSFVDTTASPDLEAQWFFYYDILDRLIEVKHVPDVSDTDVYTLYDFHWLDQRPVAYWQTDYPGGTVTRRFYHADEINRPLEVWSWPSSGDTQRVWAINPDLFGWDDILVGSSLYQPLRFPGQYYEEETIAWSSTSSPHRPALHENRHRWYDPMTGTYIQVDPKVDDTWEGYSYVAQSPVAQTDSTGEAIDILSANVFSSLSTFWWSGSSIDYWDAERAWVGSIGSFFGNVCWPFGDCGDGGFGGGGPRNTCKDPSPSWTDVMTAYDWGLRFVDDGKCPEFNIEAPATWNFPSTIKCVCETYTIHRGEWCSGWLEPFPPAPHPLDTYLQWQCRWN